jgi:hypothetical protein
MTTSVAEGVTPAAFQIAADTAASTERDDSRLRTHLIDEKRERFLKYLVEFFGSYFSQ